MASKEKKLHAEAYLSAIEDLSREQVESKLQAQDKEQWQLKPSLRPRPKQEKKKVEVVSFKECREKMKWLSGMRDLLTTGALEGWPTIVQRLDRQSDRLFATSSTEWSKSLATQPVYQLPSLLPGKTSNRHLVSSKGSIMKQWDTSSSEPLSNKERKRRTKTFTYLMYKVLSHTCSNACEMVIPQEEPVNKDLNPEGSSLRRPSDSLSLAPQEGSLLMSLKHQKSPKPERGARPKDRVRHTARSRTPTPYPLRDQRPGLSLRSRRQKILALDSIRANMQDQDRGPLETCLGLREGDTGILPLTALRLVREVGLGHHPPDFLSRDLSRLLLVLIFSPHPDLSLENQFPQLLEVPSILNFLVDWAHSGVGTLTPQQLHLLLGAVDIITQDRKDRKVLALMEAQSKENTDHLPETNLVPGKDVMCPLHPQGATQEWDSGQEDDLHLDLEDRPEVAGEDTDSLVPLDGSRQDLEEPELEAGTGTRQEAEDLLMETQVTLQEEEATAVIQEPPAEDHMAPAEEEELQDTDQEVQDILEEVVAHLEEDHPAADHPEETHQEARHTDQTPGDRHQDSQHTQ